MLAGAIRLGLGGVEDVWAESMDIDGRQILVIRRPPFVTEEVVDSSVVLAQQQIRIAYTFVFQNPGAVMLIPVLLRCSSFRALFQPHGRELYAKFCIQQDFYKLL